MSTSTRRRLVRGIPGTRGAGLLDVLWPTLVSLALLAEPADAQIRLIPELSFDGFGTVGVIYSTERNADFAENLLRSSGPGHSRVVDASVDSRIAGQATLRFGPKLEAVVQVLVEQTAEDTYRPHAEWANLSYSFTPDATVRTGRFVLPAFLVSDARKVSYANPWVRPPVELYGMMAVYSLDGADATYQRRLGEWTGRLNAAFGRTEADFPTGAVEAERMWSVNASLVRGGLTGRVATIGGTLYMEMASSLFDGFRAFGPQGIAIADEFDPDGKRFQFATAGVEYDPGDWFTIGEIGWVDGNSAIGERIAGHATAGVRRGAITPYATYSRSGLLSESSAEGLPLDGLPPEYAGFAELLNEGLNGFIRSAAVQRNLTLGTRWDLRPGIALKAQVEFIDVLGNSQGTFINTQPTFEPGGGTQVFSIATTFVF